MMSRLRPRAWSKSNSSRLLRAGNRAARMRPSPPCDSRAETSRCRQATRNSSCDPGFGAGAIGQPRHRLAQGRRLECSGQERHLGGQITAGLGGLRGRGGHHATPPSVLELVSELVVGAGVGAGGDAECGVVVVQAADLHLRFGNGSQHAGPLVAQQLRRGDVFGVGDRLVPGPDPLVIGDRPSLTEHPHPGQVGDDLDAPTDDRRVHRVVVAVQADVVITRQPQRRPPPRRGRDRRQGEHRLAVGGDPVGRRAAQRPAAAGVDQGEPLLQLSVEVLRAGEAASGQKRALQIVMRAFDQTLRLRVGRFADQHLGRQRAAEGLALGGELHPAAAPAPDRALAVPDQHPRHRTQPAISCHQPANRSAAVRVGISSADNQRE